MGQWRKDPLRRPALLGSSLLEEQSPTTTYKNQGLEARLRAAVCPQRQLSESQGGVVVRS